MFVPCASASTSIRDNAFTDRFYAEFPLALELLKMNVCLTGTVMKNRQNLPADVKKLKLKKHEVSSFVHSDDVSSTGLAG